MSKTLATALADVRARIDEPRSKPWNDAEITRWINEAARDIARKSETLQDRTDITVISGTQEYTIPSDVIRIHRVEWRPTGSTSVYPLEYRDWTTADSVWLTSQSQSSANPAMYCLWGASPNMKIVLFPTPDQGGSLKVFNYRIPTPVADSADTIEVPEGWYDALIWYCEYLARRKLADPRWQDAKQSYDEMLGNLIETSRRWTDEAGMITADSGAVLPGWLVSGEDGWW